METIRQYLKDPKITAAGAFILGLIIGLFVLGWGLFPVQWTDATPAYLRSDLKEDYLRMAIDSYSKNQDASLAKERYAYLGTDGETLLDTVGNNPGKMTLVELSGFIEAVNGSATTAQATAPATTTTSTAAVSAGTTGEEEKPASKLPLLLGGLCAATLIALGALAYVLLIRNRQRQEAQPAIAADDPTISQRIDGLNNTAKVRSEAPVAQFMTTYMTGDDLYDDSFSIDSPAGEFLGECGVGISDSLGTGDPKKVTAFEVWLFDKNDIQTVTKVLMSYHAFNEPSISQRLESKGEPILAEPGKRITLETATLQLEARVVDMNYGQGGAPANSAFERLTLELAVWPKVAERVA